MLNNQMVVVKNIRTRSIFFISAGLGDLNEQGTLRALPHHIPHGLRLSTLALRCTIHVLSRPGDQLPGDPRVFHRAPDAALFSDAPRLVYHVRNPGRCRLEGSCGCCGCWMIQLGNSYIMSSLCHHVTLH